MSMRLSFLSMKRVWFALAIKFTLLMVLICRLGQLAVLNSPHYKTLAYGNRIHCRMLSAQRGRICDEKGKILADTQQTYRVYVYSHTRQELDLILEAIEKVIGKKMHLQDQFAHKRILLLKETLCWQDMAKLEVRKIPGVFIEPIFCRMYPTPMAFSHILGYVSPANIYDDPRLRHPFLTIGHGGGIEQIYDDTLRGTMGYVEEEMDAKRTLVRILDTIPPKTGADLVTTLNKDLQEFTYNVLKEEGVNSAGVVVLDAHTGAVKTLVSYPSYDTNLFGPGIPCSLWQNLMNNPYRPLFNKVTQGQYAPGSVFKIVMALAGLKSGVISEKTCVDCPGYMDIGQRRFHCWAWRKGGHGRIDFYKAMAGSCDVFFYQMAKKINVQDVVNMAKWLGLGTKTGIDVMYERQGLLPHSHWFKSKNLGEMVNLSIGQGRLLATPLQLAVMMAMVVNGGKRVRPHCYQNTLDETADNPKIDIKNLSILKTALIQVTNSVDGTAYPFQFMTKDGGLGFGGKTGTTQVRGISQKERQNGHINSKTEFLRDHALFVGFAPVDKPQYVVAVIWEHGGWGSNACRIGQKILKHLVQ